MQFLEQNSGFEQDATEFDFRPDDETTTVKGRELGEVYESVREEPSAKETLALALHGDRMHVDRSHVEDDRRGLRDLQGWLERRLGKLYRSWAKGFEAVLFNGDHTATPAQMKGLSKVYNGTTNLPGFGITGVLSAHNYTDGADQSMDLGDSANWDAFFEMMYLALSEVDDPKGIVVGKELYARVNTIARERHIRGESRDLLGRIIPNWDGVPIIRAKDGTIPTNEANADASATDTTSLYILSPGEQRLSVVTNSGLYFNEKLDLETQEGMGIEWEIRSQWKVEEKNAGRRVRYIKL